MDDGLPRMPAWAALGRAKTAEDTAFVSGAVLSHLHTVLAQDAVPLALLRARLAMAAAEACTGFAGRPERLADLRDAVHLLRPGDLPGPAGEIALTWQRAAERRLSVTSLARALPEIGSEQISEWLSAGQGGPVACAAGVLEAVLRDARRAEEAALVLADAALARALGWGYLVPLLAIGLNRADLRKTDTELRLACHRAVAAAAPEAVRQAADLTRRAAHLRAVAPKLRAKRAGEAVALFLTRDGVAPSVLPLPDRSARRLCDRLVDLGAIRELTGRDTFRLYGM